ncbi:Syntaxin-1B [Seminavis robusta]|uniref:Syntaxin-1B n=1 Tax=Seminavis robusta TaxID=568900 RepID=A0A9N8F4E8_9STRA|nr:Syntaxin-1B [Seminavis robusta]|eukprot:Sro2940_g340680.1 Syntaxin-1B (353) ;mRNA; r:5173-6418
MNNRLDELPSFMDDSATVNDLSLTSHRSLPSSNKKSSSSKKKTTRAFPKKQDWKKIIKGTTTKKKHSKKKKIEVVVTPGEERAKLMELFYDNVEKLQKSIGSIAKAAKTIHRTTRDILEKTLSSQEEKQLDAQACRLVEQTNQKAQMIRAQLKGIQRETKELRKQQQLLLVESDFRIRDFLTSALTKQFVDELRRYQTAQGHYKVKTQQRLKRQIRTVQPNATDNDIEGMIQRGEDRDAFYQQAILAPGMINDRIRTVHETVSEKYKAIQQIEQSAAMIQGLFLDLALLVEEQGEQLDQIEFHVKQAGDYIEQGDEELHQANEYGKKVRKKKRMILLIVGGVVIVLALIVIF